MESASYKTCKLNLVFPVLVDSEHPKIRNGKLLFLSFYMTNF